MIIIKSSSKFVDEKEYIYEVIFSEFLGLEYKFQIDDNLKNTTIIIINSYNIVIEDILFSIDSNKWLKLESLPELPLNYLNVKEAFDAINLDNKIPLVYASFHKKYFEKQNNIIKVKFDLFGSCFFMLTRYEETVIKDRDNHDRFIYTDSVAYKASFLHRPIVNEYIELLWQLLLMCDSNLTRKNRTYKVIPTHDIDKPFGMLFDTKLQIIRHFVGDIVVRKSLRRFFSRIIECYNILFYKDNYINKRYETYKFMLAESSKYGLQDYYFFMNSKNTVLDGNYTVENVDVQNLIEFINEKRHKIGLHPSYETYKNKNLLSNEIDLLNNILGKLKVPKANAARQHYLRWENPITWELYENNGIEYDSSLTYAGSIGFRCGTCYEYSVFDLKNKKKLQLKEMPLIVMDGSLFEYMKLSRIEALKKVKCLANECKKYRGNFVILWHNTTLDSQEERKFYSMVLKEACDE